MSVTSETTNSSTGSKNAPKAMTNWSKTVSIAFRDGTLLCENEDHAMRGAKRMCSDGKERPTPTAKDPKSILELMEPYKKARCDCERAACKFSWSQNHPGQLQQNFVCDGAFVKGVGKYDCSMPGKKVMPTPFRLNEKELKELRERFPDWMFVQTSSSGHDHPVSHCTTMIATYELTRGLPSGSVNHPARYLDLHGNPRSNARVSGATKVINTLVNLESPKDYIRQATKWGPQLRDGKPMYHIGAMRDVATHHAKLLKSTDALLSIHTLYYYDEAEIARALSATKSKTLHAILHRHKEDVGSLNAGELRWIKTPRSNSPDSAKDVKQTNVLTGEEYVHPDSEKWFSKHTWTPKLTDEVRATTGDELGSLTWTTNMVCEGTYRLTVVAVPNKIAYIDNVSHHNAKQTCAAVNSKAHIHDTNTVTFSVLGETHSVRVKDAHIDFFDKCRKKAINKQRDAATFHSHTNYVQVAAMSVMRDHQTDVTAEELRNISLASFWVDFKVDLSNASRPSFFADALANQHNLMLKGKDVLGAKVLQDVLVDGLLIILKGKGVKDTIVKGLELAKARN